MTNYVGKGLGNYELTELLGQGGFADVYLGKHRYLQNQAALKVLRTRLDDGDEQKFLAEARILGYLRHPHIVRVLDFAVEQGTPVLIMEYAPRGTLRKHYPSGTQLPLATTVEFVLQIASALQYAHNHQVIHRDVKPENILLDADQRLLISDFGLSLLSPTPDLLSTQEPAGTFPYTAPEQLRGKPCFASDQYSLAVIAYEWLCGKRPFTGKAIELMYHHLHTAPPPLHDYCPTLPPNVEGVILRALAKDPANRFVSIQAFAQALARASQQQVVDDEESQITSPFKTVLSLSSDTSYTTLPVPAVSTAQKASTPRSESVTKHSNRHRLLSKVRSFWITGILEQSLYDLGLIALGLQSQAEAVANPWRLVLQQPGLTPQRLPAGTHITQAYDDADGALLILGEPGSGKTTLLLELTRDLLYRAEHDESHPIPVIFNLSSWATKQSPITTWLVEELNSKYQVPRKMAKAWVAKDQILPLLDGFDEVALTVRSACLNAINAYRKQHGLLPTVVCSRTADYSVQQSSILLSSAVMVQPLTDQQVDDYLASGGEATQSLRVALHQDPALRELTSTPLMLSIFMLTYHDMPVEDLLREASLTDRQRKVFEHYVECMLKRRGTNTAYTPQQTTRWLSELARQLKQHDQSIFYIERMQPDWLPEGRSRRTYARLVVGLVFGLLTALCLGPLGGMLLTNLWSKIYNIHLSFPLLLGSMLVIGVWLGAVIGSLNSLLYTHDAQRKSWSRLARRVSQGVLNGLLIGVLLGCPYGVVGYLNTHNGTVIAGEGIIIGLLGGLVYMLIDAVLGIRVTVIWPTETFAWSWAKTAWGMLKGMCLGLFSSLLIGLIIGLFIGVYEWVTNIHGSISIMNILQAVVQQGSQFVLVFAPYLTGIGGLLGGLVAGLSSNILDVPNLTTPNQGIRRSGRRGLLVGIVTGLLGVIMGGVLGRAYAGNPEYIWPFMLTYGLLFGALLGLVSGLRAGGIACIQHFTLRFLQWEAGAMPWNYPRFLDYATERILLRKVGGGYIFTHRLLLEYLATQTGG